MSLKNILRNVLYDNLEKGDGFVHKGDLERAALEHGHLGDAASRRLRKMYSEGETERRTSGRSIEYKYIPKI